MIPLSVADICTAVGGRVVGDVDAATRITGPVVADSRQVVDGSLFVCLRGERVDGHSFASAAVAAGALAVIADRDVDVAAILVDDTTTALGSLARAVLESSHARVVGVTGSSGKTSTKDLLTAVFESAGETVAPQGSFNNEIGLPLTTLRVNGDTRTLVLEYSARGIGHIRYLCDIARPDIAIVLNVGAAHLGEFGSREAIAQAKGELVEALPPAGTAILNADDPLVASMSGRTAAQVVTFGTSPHADVRISDLSADDRARPAFRLTTTAGGVDVQLRLSGAHHAANAAAAVAAALAAGIPVDDAVNAVSAVTSVSPHRMQMRERRGGGLVIDDAYNANPDSMRAALAALAAMRRADAKAWAVLGVMRELGPQSPALHAEIGAEAARVGADELIAVGDEAAPLVEGARAVAGWSGRARQATDADAVTELLRHELAPGDVVLVKASNSEQLWRVADALADPATVEVRA